jgi:ABC-2 type transport system ATP-binding protein
VLDLTEIGVRVDGRWVLRDISLRILEGEVCGLAGPNGSGKSLFLAVCATIVPAQTGRVAVGGADARSQAASVRRLIGYVPEAIGVYPRMTVREDLEFFARAHGMSRRAARDAADEMLERWSLRSVATDRMESVSRGCLQRVALGRAWMHRPRLLLLDEPTIGLDGDARKVLWREIRRHAEAGGSVLLASHHLQELARRSHRIAYLDGGALHKVVETGSLRQSAEFELAVGSNQ